MGTKDGARKATRIREERRAAREASRRGGELFPPPESKEDSADGQPATVVGGDEEIKRIALPVNADGRIVVELLTDKAKSKLARMVNDPAVRAFVDPPASAPVSSGEIDPAITGVLYDAIGSLASSIAVATGHTVDSAKLLAFTAEEKAQLAAPTAAVLSKYSGAWSKWQDEIGLGLLLTAIMQGKLSRLERRPAEVRKFPQAAPDLAPGGES